MKKLLGVLAGIALSAPLGTALAADLRVPVKAPMMAPVAVYNWTGFYVGVNVGYSWGRDPYDIAGASTTCTRVFRAFGLPARDADQRRDGGRAGICRGRTANIDGGRGRRPDGLQLADRRLVLGLETDVQWTGQKGSSDCSVLAAGCFPTALRSFTGVCADLIDSSTGSEPSAAAPASWSTPRVLLYVTGGLAYGEIKSSCPVRLPRRSGFRSPPSSTSTVKVGWTVGGGIEGDARRQLDRQGRIPLHGPRTRRSPGSVGVGRTVIPNARPGRLHQPWSTRRTQPPRARIRDNIFRVGLNYRFAPEVVVARY